MPLATSREVQLMEQLHVALEQIKGLQHQNQLLEQQNKLLREKVDLLVRRLHGIKSEKLSCEELQLLMEGFGEWPEEPKKEPAPGASSGALEAELEKAQAKKPRPVAK